MAKGDVILKFDADTGTAVQEFLKIKRAIEAAASSSREFGEDSSKAGDKASGAFGKIGQSAQAMGNSIAGQIGTFVSIGAAIKLATETATAYFDMMEQRGKKALEDAASLNSSLSGAGQAALIPQIRSYINSLHQAGGMTVNRAETEQMAGTMAAHIGTKLGDSTEKELKTGIDFALIQRAAGITPGKAAENSGTYLDFAGLRNDGAFADVGDEKLQGAAMRLGSVSGKELEILSKSNSKNFEKTVGLLIAGRQSDLRTKTLNGVLELSMQEIGPEKQKELIDKARKHPGKITEEDRNTYWLSQIAPGEERRDYILANPSIAPANLRSGIEALKRGMEKAPALQTPDQYLQSYLAGMDPETKLARAKQNVDADSANADRVDALREADKANRRQSIDARMKATHPWMYSVPGAAKLQEFGQVNDAGITYGMFGDDLIDPAKEQPYTAENKAQVNKVNSTGTPEQLQMLKLQKENNDLMRQQNQILHKANNNPMLNSNHAGQR